MANGKVRFIPFGASVRFPVSLWRPFFAQRALDSPCFGHFWPKFTFFGGSECSPRGAKICTREIFTGTSGLFFARFTRSSLVEDQVATNLVAQLPFLGREARAGPDPCLLLRFCWGSRRAAPEESAVSDASGRKPRSAGRARRPRRGAHLGE